MKCSAQRINIENFPTVDNFQDSGLFELRDFRSKERVSPETLVFTGTEGPWEVRMNMDLVSSRINRDYFSKAPPTTSKYLPLMPVRDYSVFDSLGCGASPLIRSVRLGQELGIDLNFKLEAQNPTGSFKDRGSAVEIAIAREVGAKAIVVASTGNMAASCACFAASASIPCFVFVPEDTPASKLAQVIAYGGKVVQVKGTYGDAAALAEKVARDLGFYLAGDYAFRVEGAKTAAFELIDQLFFQVPDFVIVPMGCGTNIASYYKGFVEYKQLGLIDRLPKLIGVQATGAPTIVASFNNGLADSAHLDRVDTIARAIAINYALDGSKALDAIYSTQGSAYALTDREMLEAQYRMSREEGLFTEVSCAATVAALPKLAEQQNLQGKRVVCVLPGTGLKDPTAILKVAIKPPAIEPSIDAFLELYQGGYFEGKNVSFYERDAVLFSQIPSPAQVQEAARSHIQISFSADHIERIAEKVAQFLQKGKPVTFADFQDIAQEIMEQSPTTQKRKLAVLDFSVTSQRNSQASATVEVTWEGIAAKGSGQGTGPFDALVKAIRAACGNDITFSLEAYRTEVRSHGTDAVIAVEMKLQRNGKTAIGTSASPDIMQASVEAFEMAFNEL